MKKVIIVSFLALAITAGLVFLLARHQDTWSGVDDTVVEKFAKEAGHPAREPYINTEKGDLLLFFFLIAGVSGGFVGGYCFRELFPPEKKR